MLQIPKNLQIAIEASLKAGKAVMDVYDSAFQRHHRFEHGLAFVDLIRRIKTVGRNSRSNHIQMRGGHFDCGFWILGRRNMERIAIYPGSFDPVTNGHLDILERGLKLFDKIIIAILTNPKKKFLFTLDERIEMLEESLKEFSNVEIDTFDDLTVDFAAECNAQGILRGLRAMSDFEYEFQMALMNRRLNREVQTVFLMTGLRWIYTSSSIIKEAAQFGGDIHGMVPPIVEKKIKKKFAGQT